jgi:pSer/pThr/pTyr-binding forkhead associated (FHA) protein
MEQVATTSRAFLFLQSKRLVYRCQFTKDLTLIGSQSENDIVIRDSSVQAEHARISKANDVYTLRPIADSEVQVNGEPVESTYELENGDWLEIGDVSILFAREFVESPVTVHLLIRRPGEPPMGFWTSKSTIVIGREQGDVIINDPVLSKVHTIIENFCINGWFVLDAQSERGTAVNGESIDARHALRDGDIVSLGNIEIEFRSRPFENPTGQEAARLAAERVDKLRALGGSAAAPTSKGHIPRNPYQRYPSQLPKKEHKQDQAAGRDDSPRSHPGALAEGRKAWSARPQTSARHSRKNERARPSSINKAQTREPPKRRPSLRSGLETGIFQSQTGVARDRRPSRNRPTRASSVGQTVASSVTGTQESTHSPALKPRTGLESPRNKRSFAERSEQNTRLSFSDSKGSGLWYLPSGERKPGPRRALEAPIIAARGDKVPPGPPASNELIADRAMVPRRTDATDLRPMTVPRARVKTSPPLIRRMPQTEVPPAKGQESSLPNNAPAAPGRRPDASERWYTPGHGKKPIRQQPGQKAWYLPSNSTDDNDDDIDFAPVDHSGKGGTQVFDGEDY